MNTTRRAALTGIVTLVAVGAGYAQSILASPKTLIDRAIEARCGDGVRRVVDYVEVRP